jgi:predicted amidohydrolase
MKPKLADFNGNLNKMKHCFEEIMKARPDTDLIVFPELITSGYECTKEEFEKLAEVIPGGKSVTEIASLCGRYGVNAVYGLPERVGETLYNAAAAIGSNGEVLHVYRKAHPFDTERRWCAAGRVLNAFDMDFGRVGVMICWDTAFPEVARAYALQGAELLIVVTNWEKPYSDDWDLVTRARAFDNTLHLVSANRVGFDKTLGFFGHSNIVDPVGKVIASLDEETEGVVCASLDLKRTKLLRESYYTFFEDRQPDIYADLVRRS